MHARPGDSVPTVAAIGLLAYASADIGHHALGHGTACLAAGGRITSLSSIFVDCTVRGSSIDLAGPAANLLIGALALLAARASTAASAGTRLFFTLTAAFNLLWFTSQLTFSAASRTDDWAWAMQEYHATALMRGGMVAAGAMAYLVIVRVIAHRLAPFAEPLARLRTLVMTSWLTAGLFACATALLDRHPLAAEFHHAAPQSFLTSIGLLVVPRVAAKVSSPRGESSAIDSSLAWLTAAAVVGIASIVLLGPGIAVR